MKRMLLTLALGLIPAALPASAMAHDRDRGHGGFERIYRPHEFHRDYGAFYGVAPYVACPSFDFSCAPYAADCYGGNFYYRDYRVHHDWDRHRAWGHGEYRHWR